MRERTHISSVEKEYTKDTLSKKKELFIYTQAKRMRREKRGKIVKMDEETATSTRTQFQPLSTI